MKIANFFAMGRMLSTMCSVYRCSSESAVYSISDTCSPQRFLENISCMMYDMQKFLAFLKVQDVLVTHDCPRWQQSPKSYCLYKYYGQGHKATWKGFISWVCMPNMKHLFLMVQKLWSRLKFLCYRVMYIG